MNNSTVAEVVAKFKNDRINKEFLRQQQADSLPGMKAIKDRKKQILKQIFMESISGVKTVSSQNELKELDRKEAALLSSITTQFRCAICSDSGFVDGVFCKCLRDEIYKKVYGGMDIANLEESFENSNKNKSATGFQCINGDTQQTKYTKIENYTKAYVNHYPNNKKINLLMSGQTGLGKSYILHAMAKKLHSSGHDVLLINAAELFSVFHRHRLGYDVNLTILYECGILLLDDLGAEPATQNVTVEYFLDLLNKRIDNKKHMVVATNLSSENIIERYGERIYSRLRFKELCDQLVFEGSDIRLT